MPGLDAPLELRAVHLQLPLTVPYRLAFGEQRRFDVLLVGIRDDAGRVGWGEATILPGYTDETVSGAWTVICDVLQHCRRAHEIRSAVTLAHSPFAASAFLTALDWLDDHPVLRKAGRFPLLGTVNGKGGAGSELELEIERLIAAGYRTLKLKVGWDADHDLDHVAAVQSIANGRAKLRVDANQGYTRDQARDFLSRLDPRDIELVEQPCAAGDWDAAIAAKQAAGVPLMLDESIYSLDDIDRAASLKCADFIKLKLMKVGALDTLERGLRLIAEHGMIPVLGNGVASDLGCWMELAVAIGVVPTAGEMNGFLKTPAHVLRPLLKVESGEVVLDGRRPEICEEVLAAHAVTQAGGWRDTARSVLIPC